MLCDADQAHGEYSYQVSHLTAVFKYLCKGALRLQLSMLDLGIHASNTSLISIDEHVGVAF